MSKIKQTAGKDALGDFAPEFAHFNDDILFGENGPILCEVNSNAHFKNIYDCTGENVADYIIEYINEAMK